MDVGRRCGRASLRDVACELNVDWHPVKDWHMRLQSAKAGVLSLLLQASRPH